jgi:glycosyltransferase involved in cell wall biosynthesis
MTFDQTPQIQSETRLISLIIPCYNEEKNIQETIESVTSALRDVDEAYEIIAINDASKDDTLTILHRLQTTHPNLQVLDLMRNSGQSAAYQVGLDQAIGTHVLFYSGDLEIPANNLIQVIEQLDQGKDFVNTSRKDRWGGSHAFKSKIANRILNKISGLTITDRGSGLKGMSREVAKSMQLYGEWHRFLPDLATLYTERIVEFEVPFEERKAGTSSYRGKMKSITVFLDLATVTFTLLSQRKPYHLLPGRFFGFTGLILGAIGSCISLWLIIQKFAFAAPLSDRPLFMVSILMTILGFIMVMVGVLGELIIQISTAVNRPHTHLIRPNPNTTKRT